MRRQANAIALSFAVSVVAACGTEPAADGDLGAGVDAGAPSDGGSMDTTRDTVTADTGVDAPAPDVAEPGDVNPPLDTTVVDPPPDDPDPALVEACEGSCIERETIASDVGFCDLDTDRSCTDLCVDAVGDQPSDIQVAFFVCLKTDPLCFQTPLQCVLGQLYPEPFEHTTTLVGEGYDAWGGAPVYVAMERPRRPGTFDVAEGEVDADGRFEVGIEGVRSANAPHTMFYFVDSDSDRSCDPELDLGGSAGVQLYSWPIDDVRVPDWRIAVRPEDDRSSDFICDLMNGAIAP